MKIKTGQAGIETLIMVALGLTFIMVLFYLTVTTLNDQTAVSKADEAVKKIAGAIDYAYSSGPGTRYFVDINLPSGISNLTVSGNRIRMRVHTSAGDTDVYANTRASLSGGFNTDSGKQTVQVYHLETGGIQVGDFELSATPSSYSTTLNESESAQFTINLTNFGQRNITGISASVSGDIIGMAGTTQPASTLQPFQSTLMTVSITVPNPKTTGTYSGEVLITSQNDGSAATSISINVNGQAPVYDLQGPEVFYLTYSPASPTANDSITINATGDDTGRGNGKISLCQLQIDGGAWSSMSANDGAYDEITEQAYRNIGTLSPGIHLVSAMCQDNSSNWGTESDLVVIVGGADILGPIVSGISFSPSRRLSADSINVTATASDLATGGSNVTSCAGRLDGGSLFSMSASDGAFNSPSEGITASLGVLSAGSHYIYINCTDSLGNHGGAAYLEFTIYTEIMFIKKSDTMTTEESKWDDFMDGMASAEGFSWDRNYSIDNDVVSGAASLSNYKAVFMAEYSNSVGIETALTNYLDAGGRLILTGPALQYGPNELGYSSYTGSEDDDYRTIGIVNNAHYITANFSIGSATILSSGGYNIHAVRAFSGTMLANSSKSGWGDRTALGVSGNMVMFGADRADKLDSSGIILARRLIDYSLLNSGIGE